MPPDVRKVYDFPQTLFAAMPPDVRKVYDFPETLRITLRAMPAMLGA